MREIKFRFWYKGAMHYSHDDGTVGENDLSGGDDLSWWIYSDEPVTMQFTGLHDKGGKEIYEGDVVSRFADTQRSVVEFRDGCFVSMIRRSGGHHEADWDILCNDLSVTEVIGNIYENPELIST